MFTFPSSPKLILILKLLLCRLKVKLKKYVKTWRTLVAGDEQPYQPCGKSSYGMMHLQLKLKINFMD